MFKKAAGLFFLAAFLFVAVACKPDTPPVTGTLEETTEMVVVQAPPPAWNTFVTQFIETYLAAHPAFAVVQGRHEFDGILPDWSARGIAGEIARLERARKNALAFNDAELGDEGQFQRDYLIASIDRALFWLDKAEWPFVNPAFYFDGMSDTLDPAPYLTLDYAPLDERIKSYTRFAGNIPSAAEQIRANLRMPMARTRLQYGIDSFGGLANFFSTDVPVVFSAVEDKNLQEAFNRANTAAAAAMQELADWMKGNLETATDDYALGQELFQQMMYDTVRVNLTLEELEALGRDDMRRNRIALGEACAEFAPGESIRGCFARMANRELAGGAVESARLQWEEARTSLAENGRVFGRIFINDAFAEGWAHYTEEMMLEDGFRGASAETRIGQLANALLRNARFLSAIGLHTRGMTVEESEKLFMEQAYLDERTARQQAARGTYDPAYLNSTLGKLMIKQLRSDWTSTRGGRQSWREFHDTFLSFGGPPIPLVRVKMLKNP